MYNYEFQYLFIDRTNRIIVINLILSELINKIKVLLNIFFLAYNFDKYKNKQ